MHTIVNFHHMRDDEALRQLYNDRVVIYVESEADIHLYSMLLGIRDFDPKRSQTVFRVPASDFDQAAPASERENVGFGAVARAVKTRRDQASKWDRTIFVGICDGDAVVAFGGLSRLIEERDPLFVLAESTNSVFYLNCHEIENIIVLYGGLITLLEQWWYAAPERSRSEKRLQLPDNLEILARSLYISSMAGLVHRELHRNKDGLDKPGIPNFGAGIRKARNKLRDYYLSIDSTAWPEYVSLFSRVRRKSRKRAQETNFEIPNAEYLRICAGKELLKAIEINHDMGPHWRMLLMKYASKSEYGQHFRMSYYKLLAAASGSMYLASANTAVSGLLPQRGRARWRRRIFPTVGPERA